jgi:hypothetical protein
MLPDTFVLLELSNNTFTFFTDDILFSMLQNYPIVFLCCELIFHTLLICIKYLSVYCLYVHQPVDSGRSSGRCTGTDTGLQRSYLFERSWIFGDN